MRLVLFYIYTLLAYTFLYPFTFLAVIIILVLNTFKCRKGIVAVIRFWALGSFVIIGKRYTIEGEENINKDRKYIILANHSSLFDIMGIMAIYPSSSFFGKAYLMEIPVFGKVLEVINYIPMKSSDLRNTKQMIEQLVKRTENQTVAIFPEGTRTTNGEMSTLRKGFLHVLKASKLDILPLSLVGFYNFKPKNKFCFNYGHKLSAKIHAPIPYAELEKLEDKEIIEKVQTIIESALKNNNQNGAK